MTLSVLPAHLLAVLASAHVPVLPPSAEPVAPPSPVAALHAWDERRAAAWAAGDLGALRRLYTARSAAGAADVAMLRAWRARGLRVTGMRMQLFAVDVRRAHPARLELLVTDRLVGAVAVGGGVRVRLPYDGVSTRRVVLVRRAGEWRMAQSLEASPARTTSWPVWSRKE